MELPTPRDARSLSHATLEEMRRLAVRRVVNGETHRGVAASLEVNRRTVTRWVGTFRNAGEEGLASTKATGRPCSLAPKQVERLRRIVVGKNPMQLNFGSALWTLPVLRQLIENKFKKVLHPTTISRLLHRIGLTPQKPQRRAFQRDDAECAHWASNEFPKIVRRAKQLKATLLFADETGMRESAPVGTTWGIRGQRPVVRAHGGHKRVNVISAISPRGRFWFRCFKKMLNASLFIEFLEAMLHDLKGRIVLVLDRHPAHTAAATRRFLEANKARIEVFHLPAYAPDMNPDEHVWAHLKGIFRRAPLRAEDNLEASVQDTLGSLAADRDLLMSFFGHPDVAYVKQALRW